MERSNPWSLACMTGNVGVLCSQPDEKFHYRIIFIDISTSDEETDVLAIWNNSFLVYTNFIVDEFTSEVTEENRTDLNLEEIASHDLFSVLFLAAYWYTLYF